MAGSGGETDPLTRLHIRAATRQAQDDSERVRQQAYAEKAWAASQLYDKLAPATDSHPYLLRKGVSADPALRVTRNNRLVIPFYNHDDKFSPCSTSLKMAKRSSFLKPRRQATFTLQALRLLMVNRSCMPRAMPPPKA
jgi:putative DNA primase/helicase